ncbi:hypothetical protein EMIHUDRAFT_108753 [Emiliania huxleyi CCMP1516]|uniref:Methyltransferase n=2 Tax=Emiliania huxleyi TaxID=2903 RepID=A0A0D3KW62_EMIH1|nr:hypothetical protein EMIHUDRAFT_108753 [Emiliania huxleyi CCMP1516]EOD39997.1 hypothetical protein EMIHUDRAFT_108753 [Emiliania huxleyi CCMP1516]|eukprot:XP_005792426.1 hypothetical protein EMIHUDRAFT_108753 [Emiliania huxleyi CCMP1516]
MPDDAAARGQPLEPSAFTDAPAELPDWSRTFCGYNERFVAPFSFAVAGHRLSLTQSFVASPAHQAEARSSADGLATGSTVWDAGAVLGAMLLRQPPPTVGLSACGGCEGACLDLGSGTGIVGLAAAASGAFARVVLTDLPSVVSLLEANAARNAARLPASVRVSVEAERHGPFRLVVGGDLLYRPPTVQPLLGVLDAVCGAETHVLLAASLQHSPETMRLFAEAARGRGFEGRILPAGEQHPSYASGEVRILHLSRRQHPR